MLRVTHIVALLLFISCSLTARVWTDYRGREMEAELIQVKDGYASFRKSDGVRYIFPLRELSIEDQNYIESLNVAAEPTELPESNALKSTKLTTWLEKNLVASDGKRVRKAKESQIPQAEYIAFYFSASWCPPCRKFTPKLVDFYNTHRKAHSNFEIVFVSSDRDEDSQEDYMLDYDMPWPAVEFDEREERIVKGYSGRGIPCLVIVDRDGKVIQHSYVNGNYKGPTSVMNKLESLLDG